MLFRDLLIKINRKVKEKPSLILPKKRKFFFDIKKRSEKKENSKVQENSTKLEEEKKGKIEVFSKFLWYKI